MSKIRINELARELEVKPGEILRVLPDLGVADKKTHSSSLDDDVVEAIRKRFHGQPKSTEIFDDDEHMDQAEEAPVRAATPPPSQVAAPPPVAAPSAPVETAKSEPVKPSAPV